MRKTRKPLAIGLALALVAALGVGGTLAWLTDETGPVTNTFTVGNIGIELAETKTNFKMVPGCAIEKDPVVTVEAGSEDCWLFVEVAESDNFDDFIEYGIAGGWTAGEGSGEGKNGVPAGVYFREVASADDDQEFGVIGYTKDGAFVPNKVLVKDTVTKQMMDALTAAGEDSYPTLTFTAYAVQLYETNGVAFEPAEAWAIAKSATDQE